MIQINSNFIARYFAFIGPEGVAKGQLNYYLKWLRYYLDFCQKFGFNRRDSGALPAFIEKLREKNQAENLREQAEHAIILFLAMESSPPTPAFSHNNKMPLEQGLLPAAKTKGEAASNDTPLGNKLRLSGADWTEVFTALKNAIMMRHYSPKTLKTYLGWAKRFQTYLKSKDPALRRRGRWC